MGKIRRTVVTHVPTEDLPQGIIHWRIVPTNCGSRSNNPSLKRRIHPCWLTRALSLISTLPRGVLSPCPKCKKTAALGSGSKLPLHAGLFETLRQEGLHVGDEGLRLIRTHANSRLLLLQEREKRGAGCDELGS